MIAGQVIACLDGLSVACSLMAMFGHFIYSRSVIRAVPGCTLGRSCLVDVSITSRIIGRASVECRGVPGSGNDEFDSRVSGTPNTN